MMSGSLSTRIPSKSKMMARSKTFGLPGNPAPARLEPAACGSWGVAERPSPKAPMASTRLDINDTAKARPIKGRIQKCRIQASGFSIQADGRRDTLD